MARWIIKISALLEPLYNLMVEELRTNSLVNMDETPFQVHREKGRENTSKSYMWMALGRDEAPLVVFHYSPNRNAAVVRDMVGDHYTGTIQADAFSAYGAYAKKSKGDVLLISCLAHTRRRFAKIVKANSIPAGDDLTLKILARIDEIFAEHRRIMQIDGLSPQDIVRAKHARVGPMVDDLEELMRRAVARVPEGSSQDLVAAAAKYGLKMMDGLRAYLDDPIASPDNNIAEREIKPLVILRKNSLFSDSPRGAKALSTYSSLVESAKFNDLNPDEYLWYVLWHIKRADTREKLEALLPYNLTPADIKVPEVVFLE